MFYNRESENRQEPSSIAPGAILKDTGKDTGTGLLHVSSTSVRLANKAGIIFLPRYSGEKIWLQSINGTLVKGHWYAITEKDTGRDTGTGLLHVSSASIRLANKAGIIFLPRYSGEKIRLQ